MLRRCAKHQTAGDTTGFARISDRAMRRRPCGLTSAPTREGRRWSSMTWRSGVRQRCRHGRRGQIEAANAGLNADPNVDPDSMLTVRSSATASTAARRLVCGTCTSIRCCSRRCVSPGASRPSPAFLGTDSQQAWSRKLRTACPAEPQTSSATAPDAAETRCLESFLVWLVSNGATGIGLDSSKIALYEDETGDRGVLCDNGLSPGEVVLRVPLRLAITDVADEELHPAWSEPEVLPQDRLVAKLLRERSRGSTSPWAPYLQVLPSMVPCAVAHFTEEQAAECQLPQFQQQLQQQRKRLRKLFDVLPAPARYGAGWDSFMWAHSVVMSRTFGNAGASGGIGVRMLVPLVDMLNHAGDETRGLMADEPVAQDNVRWDVVSPGNSPAGCWEMVLSCKAPIAPGQPLLLSYFEGSSDEFLLHYGFVPPCNPHDVVVLAPNLRDALELCWQADAAAVVEQGRPLQVLAQRYSSSLDVGLQVLEREVAQAAATAGDDWGQLLAQLEPIQVARQGGVSGPLVAALEELYGGAAAAVNLALAAACLQHMQQLGSHLVLDLALLAADAGELQQPGPYSRALQHYQQVLPPELLPADAALSSSSSSSSSAGHHSNIADVPESASQGPFGVLAGPPRKRKPPVPGPSSTSPAADQQHGADAPATPLAAPPGSDAAVLIRQLVCPRPGSPAGDPGVAAAASCSTSGTAAATYVPPDAARLAAGGFLPYAVRCAVAYRASKKQLLWDAVLAAGCPLEALQQRVKHSSQAPCDSWDAYLESRVPQ